MKTSWKCLVRREIVIPVIAMSLFSRPVIALGDGKRDCGSSSNMWVQEKSINELRDPGWFEVGAGMVVVRNAGQSQSSAVGNLVTLRAYPFARWYSQLKTIKSQNIAVIKAKTTLATQAESAVEAAEKAGTPDEDKLKQAAAAAEDLAKTMKLALEDFGEDYAICEAKGFTHLGKRISVFLGRSVGGFKKETVDGDINAYGIAFDISPQFALVWGRAYYTPAAQNNIVRNTRSGAMFGVQINLSAFKAIRGLTGSL